MNYKIAEFSVRKPKKVDAESVIVMVPGSNDDGRWFTNHQGLKQWADRNKAAIVGCYFEDKDPSAIEGYADAKGGSGDALIKYIESHGLKDLPMLLWGFSAGGQFNHEFACTYPELVKAYVVNKGGFYYTALAPKRTRQIPALYFVGNYDDIFRQNILRGIVGMNKRDYDCQWNLIPESVGHEIGDSFEKSLTFFERVLSQ